MGISLSSTQTYEKLQKKRVERKQKKNGPQIKRRNDQINNQSIFQIQLKLSNNQFRHDQLNQINQGNIKDEITNQQVAINKQRIQNTKNNKIGQLKNNKQFSIYNQNDSNIKFMKLPQNQTKQQNRTFETFKYDSYVIQANKNNIFNNLNEKQIKEKQIQQSNKTNKDQNYIRKQMILKYYKNNDQTKINKSNLSINNYIWNTKKQQQQRNQIKKQKQYQDIQPSIKRKSNLLSDHFNQQKKSISSRLKTDVNFNNNNNIQNEEGQIINDKPTFARYKSQSVHQTIETKIKKYQFYPNNTNSPRIFQKNHQRKNAYVKDLVK